MSQASAQTWPEQGAISIDNSSVFAKHSCVPDSLGDILYVDAEDIRSRNSDLEQMESLGLLLLLLIRAGTHRAGERNKGNS